MVERSSLEDGFGLQVGVVGGAHHRAAGDLREADRLGVGAELVEFRGRDEALDREVVETRLQVLPQGQHIDVVRAHVAQHLPDLVDLLAETEHQAGLGRHRRVQALEFL